MQTTLETTKKKLLKRFHTVLHVAGIDGDGKAVILAQYGVQSSTELSVYDLMEIVNNIETRTNVNYQMQNKWRKRVLAVISNWLKIGGNNRARDIDYVKSIATRAARAEEFNKIPTDRLKSLYNAFRQRIKDYESAIEIEAIIESDSDGNDIYN